MHDVLTNVSEKTIKCLDKGHVTILDVMPRLVPDDRKTADYAIVQAANYAAHPFQNSLVQPLSARPSIGFAWHSGPGNVGAPIRSWLCSRLRPSASKLGLP